MMYRFTSPRRVVTKSTGTNMPYAKLTVTYTKTDEYLACIM